MLKPVAMAMAAVLTIGGIASAQTSTSGQSSAAAQQSARPDPTSTDLRPATTTFMGDTGL